MNDTAINAAPASPQEAVEFLGSKPRFETLTLMWPVKYQGVEYHEVTVRRLTTEEVSRYVAQIQAAKTPEEKSTIRPPMFNVPVPVLDGLDDDDTFELDKMVRRFLPRRFTDSEESA